jgi:hypothetical protein
MPGILILLAATGAVEVKIGDVPVFDELAEGGRCFEPLELAKPFDGKGVRGVELLKFTLEF